MGLKILVKKPRGYVSNLFLCADSELTSNRKIGFPMYNISEC